MDSNWASHGGFQRRADPASNYCDLEDEISDLESFCEGAKDHDPCHPGRSFAWPLEKDCESEDDEYDKADDYYEDPCDANQIAPEDDGCGDSELSDSAAFFCPDDVDPKRGARDDVLSDCVFHERQINDAIRRINVFTTLDEFIGEVAHLTEDGGAVMKELMTKEVVSFRNFIHENVYKARIEHKEAEADEDYLRIQDKFKRKIENMKNKINEGIRAIERVLPDFNYEDYKKYGYGYIHDLLAEAEKGKEGKVHLSHEDANREIRATQHKAKWFSKEARRLERKNDKATYAVNKMYQKLAEISNNLALSNNRLHTYNIQLEKYACCLKSRICRNQEQLDYLVQASGAERITPCPPIRPEDVIEDCVTTFDCCQ